MNPALSAVLWLTCSPGVAAQMTHDHAAMQHGSGSWELAWDARAFVGWNYQFMGLGVAYQRTIGTWRTFAEVDAVGAPALGPQAFMHRPSAETNPTAPLSHHMLDSTYNTPGVITFAVQRGSGAIAGSWFRAEESDENRKDIDFGALDSWSLQGRWHRGPWDAQVSGAHLTTPEYVDPFNNVTRLTASIAYAAATGRLAATLAWGQNREIHGNLDGYLVEAVAPPRAGHAWYGRAELVTKDILGAGSRHPRGFTHFHPLSRVGALTAGYLLDVSASRAGLFSIGADATVYHVAENLLDNYGAPASFHVFMRYEPSRLRRQTPIHH